MANLFYGVSANSTEDAGQKEVIIYNPLHDEIVPGDLLAVYFSHGNTVVAPTLVINGTSLSSGEDDQTALSEDAGIFIKTKNIEDNVDYMWQAGEVCLFVLVSQQDNTDVVQEYNGASQDATANDTLYYMLVRGTRANSKYYGLTKLFTDSFGEGKEYVDFDAWLNTEDAPEDTTTAATPYLIKELARRLIGNSQPSPEPEPEPGPEPEPESESGSESESSPESESESESGSESESEPETLPYIHYEIDNSAETGAIIGTLYVGSQSYTVKIPNRDTLYEKTSQFHNNADIISETLGIYTHDRQPLTGYTAGTYFITNVLDNNLYLYKNKPTGIYIAENTVEQTGLKAPVEGDLLAKELLVRTENNSTRLNYSYIDNPLNVYGKPINFYTNNSTNATFSIGLTSGYNNSTIPLKATELFEGNTSLINKYSRRLVIKSFIIGRGSTSAKNQGCYRFKDSNNNWVWRRRGFDANNTSIAIDSNSSSGHVKVYVTDSLTNLRPLGIVGWNISYATSDSTFKPVSKNSSDASYQNLWELFITDAAKGSMVVNYDSRNTANRKVYINILIYVLCVEA